ncbi:CMGC family protein kinase [Trichomonas vaginalis G3]|uniref:non-specific serine/threonine protein kinase n=1 Tax=Trichomonas vaginalis (strain ATCC PRA-98 / G3) TaxID=412133 RepID=A2DJJ8_TRIV3|nr:STKc GSK3 domain-containing protein [Trichomonas vaginalis G3]EAY19398.1 CMGC family protein kinase [Trichomonas vaginalis G3]KAI5493204.1 STKc GSK3 domain-containing protein [Trichomonas vaginalis G3]|eukprot:XP_001580384.1 CMGC family protein kinase [Trichomonas vaginalis G3]
MNDIKSGYRMSSFRVRGAMMIKNKKKSSTALTSPRANGHYNPLNIIGKGAFGVVFCARAPTGDVVAIKKVLIDPRYKNRELDIISTIKHHNCITLRDSFRIQGRKKGEIFLNIVMDYYPMTLYDFTLNYRNQRLYVPILYIKLFSYQLFAGLRYLHKRRIVHRDIKPQNLLVNQETGVLKICDFGSAKIIKPGDKSVSYIASRFYRAPELILDCQVYGPPIDIWASGCVIAEAINSASPLFVSETSNGQINAIIKIFGQPNPEDFADYAHGNSVPTDVQQETTLEKVLPGHTPPDLIDLLKKCFIYNPNERITAEQAMAHPCFNELFHRDIVLPSGKPFPPLDPVL